MSPRAHSLAAAAAALLAASASVAQPALPFATTDEQVALVEQISQFRLAGGPASADTMEPLRALALLYAEDGNDALAIPILEEARHVARVHQGLASVDEALLLRQQIRSEKALDAHERVWNLEQDMVTIARRHHDDVRMAPIFRELAEDRVEALTQYRAGHFPPEIYLGCYYVDTPRRYDDTRGRRGPPLGSKGSCRSGDRSTVYRQLNTEILLYYADAIEVLVRSGDFASQELRDLEHAALELSTFPPLANTCRRGALDELLKSPLIGTCLEPVRHIGGHTVANVGGWVSLVRLIAYEVRSGAPPSARASAVAEFADWHLQVARRDGDGRFLDERAAMARMLYELAYGEFRKDDAQGTVRTFAPDLPVVLPTSAANPFATASSSRYIDVSFAITNYGKGERIEILDSSNDATRAEQRDLIRMIELANFRPRVVDGELAAAAPVTLRYNLGP